MDSLEKVIETLKQLNINELSTLMYHIEYMKYKNRQIFDSEDTKCRNIIKVIRDEIKLKQEQTESSDDSSDNSSDSDYSIKTGDIQLLDTWSDEELPE